MTRGANWDKNRLKQMPTTGDPTDQVMEDKLFSKATKD